MEYNITYTNLDTLEFGEETYYTLLETLRATQELEDQGFKVEVKADNGLILQTGE